MRGWMLVVAGVPVAAAAAVTIALRRDAVAPAFRFAKIERGSIVSVVTATGTLSAVKTVEVGTQVSGLIAKLFVDFNDTVERGQVIAQLDTTLLESNLRDAEATLERAQAELEQSKRDLDRLTALHDQGISTAADFNKAQYSYAVSRASVKSAEASLARARQNLAYATITAPVSGTVIERDVDVGQTVAASLATPKLFVIANDLSEMRILAPVAESDIGQIREGQAVRFTVKAYPERRFAGVVRQVRLQSTTEQNIVNYTVAISVHNPDRKLLPGMTATVEFVLASANNVLTVPNAALRFRPSEALQNKLRQQLDRQITTRPAARDGGERGLDEATTGAARGGTLLASGPGDRDLFPDAARWPWSGTTGDEAASAATLLYYLTGNGSFAAMPVITGITDGQVTEVSGPLVAEGLQVIAGTSQAASSSATSGNPFQSSRSASMLPPPPGGF